MVLCIIAFAVFAIMSIFSAKYRPLAKQGFECVFRTVTLRPCNTGLDDHIKAELVSGVLKYSPSGARILNKHYVLFSWIIVLLSIGSLGYTAYGIYNFYVFGNCDGPSSTNACVLNTITGDYGRFSEPTQLVAPSDYSGISEGNINAPIKIIEFGCFTCPYTKEAQPTMSQVLSKYNGSVYYVFKPFPLPNHNNSYDAARAVLCARDQGKQYELQNLIFRQQDVCRESGSMEIKNLAQDAGLNMSAFNQCYDNNMTNAELEKYIQQGKDAHIYATPTFFVNGKAVVGPKSLEQFECVLNDKKDIVAQVKCFIDGMG